MALLNYNGVTYDVTPGNWRSVAAKILFEEADAYARDGQKIPQSRVDDITRQVKAAADDDQHAVSPSFLGSVAGVVQSIASPIINAGADVALGTAKAAVAGGKAVKDAGKAAASGLDKFNNTVRLLGVAAIVIGAAYLLAQVKTARAIGSKAVLT